MIADFYDQNADVKVQKNLAVGYKCLTCTSKKLSEMKIVSENWN